MCLVIAGVANQSQTKSHISYSVTGKSRIIHMMGTHERNPIASSLRTYFCLARFIVNATHHQHGNDKTSQGI